MLDKELSRGRWNVVVNSEPPTTPPRSQLLVLHFEQLDRRRQTTTVITRWRQRPRHQHRRVRHPPHCGTWRPHTTHYTPSSNTHCPYVNHTAQTQWHRPTVYACHMLIWCSRSVCLSQLLLSLLVQFNHVNAECQTEHLHSKIGRVYKSRRRLPTDSTARCTWLNKYRCNVMSIASFTE